MFDTTVQVYSAAVGATSEEAIEAGHNPEVELIIGAALFMPMQNPQTGQSMAVPVPAGTYRFKFPRDDAIEFFRAGLEAAEALPEPKKPSDILTASNMGQVEELAKKLQDVQ